MSIPMQETFEVVMDSLLLQGAPSTDPSVDGLSAKFCLYRGPDGRRCAAGVLISDELYSPEMEGLPIRTIFFKAGLDGHDLDLVSALQNVHDTAAVENLRMGEDWKEIFKRLARNLAGLKHLTWQSRWDNAAD